MSSDISASSNEKKCNPWNYIVDFFSCFTKEKLLIWILGTVMGGILPLALNILGYLINPDQTFVFSGVLSKILSHGELVLISSGINSATLMEIFCCNKKKFKTMKIMSGGLTLITYGLQCLFFASLMNSNNNNIEMIRDISIIFFIISIILGTSNLILSEVE